MIKFKETKVRRKKIKRKITRKKDMECGSIEYISFRFGNLGEKVSFKEN